MARFLIIEPHADIRRLYAAVIRGMGHEPILFDGVSTGVPDVILVEPADPESFEVARQFHHDYPDAPIVCASIYERSLLETRALQSVTYLLKPFVLVELTEALELALSRRRRLS
ncbi:MAG TPA: response regulator [Gaiellaceae bacterium]|nr:response regulator [Gaiellaceae bacterium]